jgi:hypothetical protein
MDNPHYVTPEEAQTKWCPIQNPPQACVGKECMAWQWAEQFNTVIQNGVVTSKTFARYSTTHGYCGMVQS